MRRRMCPGRGYGGFEKKFGGFDNKDYICSNLIIMFCKNGIYRQHIKFFSIIR